MPKRIVLIAATVALLSIFPTRLSAQQKYVGLTLCSAELQSSHPADFSAGLDRARRAFVAYREMPNARLVMIVVYPDGEYKCGTVRDAREFKYSHEVFDEECIEIHNPENVVVGFFD